jgi:DNA-binding transcriptional ArsR family regulator
MGTPESTSKSQANRCPLDRLSSRITHANVTAAEHQATARLAIGWLMIELVLAHADLARVRFAHSPIRELVTSLLVLQDPRRQPMYGRWLSRIRPQLGDLQLELLIALAPAGRYLPSFLLPPPTRPWPALADELAAVTVTHSAVVREELDLVRDGRPLPGVLRALYQDPAAHLPSVAKELGRYWRVAVAPVWPRLRALCAADLAHRMERFADGGLDCVLERLHSDVSFAADVLQIDKPHLCSHRIDLAGTGIVLVPCAFIWPTVLVECCGVDQPTLTYPPRGVAELWEDPRHEVTDPLSALIGRTRAALLASLGLPRTTTQLAVQLGLSPPAVSQHLKVLKDTGLVTARRRGRMVLYQRTPTATTLLEAIHAQEQTG